MPDEASNKALPKAYDFRDVEPHWYKEWTEKGLFTATFDPERPYFSMVIPPPNVTGVLHIGHALNNTLQDILVRYKRMDGYNTLWVPGTDHAGIATQIVVERRLDAEGQSRHDFGREKFIEKVWEWKASSGGRIIEQLKGLGCSCDWSRERFTMDKGLSRAVREVFVRLYEEGLIYRGNYIINWCPRCHTALADIEVEHKETEGRLWYMRYPLAENAEEITKSPNHQITKFITVATTRPETMLGDTAVAVHPEDPRYKDFIGKDLMLPLLNRRIPVVADAAVEPEFGTGAVKVTPAHDLNDFEIAKRQGLQSINIFDENAILTEAAGQYAGLDRYKARKQVIADLKKQGLLEKEEAYDLAVGICYRCKTVVEPRLSKQWFVKVAPLAKPALKAVKDKQTILVPASWERTYDEWMTTIRDWCISRQIWWGHRIPAWTCAACGEVIVVREGPKACPKCGNTDLEQESDVLDTWFSSAIWPFSTLGWPDKTPELETFYPTSVLITSFDILFFWVAKMMMMGLHFMGDVPFKHVYLHALIRDIEGKKMSKSRGNVIDPLTIMEKYGTDAVRFTLAAFAAQGRDIKLAEERIEGYRHFVNKIWNAARFVLLNLKTGEDGVAEPPEPDSFSDPSERWILSRLNQVTGTVRKALDEFDFDVAAKELYQFFWHEYCDWYLELAKPALTGAEPDRQDAARWVTLSVLDHSLRLFHPFIPFVTEELWHHLPGQRDHIMVSPFPKPVDAWNDARAEDIIKQVMEVVSSTRNARSELGIHPGAKIIIIALPHSENAYDFLDSQEKAINTLAGVETLNLLKEGELRPEGAATVILEDLEIFIPLEGFVDIEEELRKLTKEEKKLGKELAKTEAKLKNENFLSRAPQEIVQKERDKINKFQTKLKKIVSHKETLESIEF
ncbi:MAG: valine--tRNA ligase [Deltaproteobacteria bacterium]|nr:MAG: valine--tRNA ligase [Deltaproteobacteria bacterium]